MGSSSMPVWRPRSVLSSALKAFVLVGLTSVVTNGALDTYSLTPASLTGSQDGTRIVVDLGAEDLNEVKRRTTLLTRPDGSDSFSGWRGNDR